MVSTQRSEPSFGMTYLDLVVFADAVVAPAIPGVNQMGFGRDQLGIKVVSS